jgi:hypothetical protein|tara:strand:- start:314 stop:454 length:141 start_codon:yes stop_codon:yes gene_type:complete
MGNINQRKKVGQYKIKEKNEIRLSSYIKKRNNELGKNIQIEQIINK